MFGPRVGFLKFKAAAQLQTATEGLVDVPGIVFCRGGSIGVLVILECDGEEFSILTRQARTPVGLSNLPEIPAGMLDGSGDFKGVAAEEMAEECGIQLGRDDLVDLNALAWQDAEAHNQWQGMIPSAGGCDEFVRLYVSHRTVDRTTLDELQGRMTGLAEEGERIQLQIVPLRDLWHLTPDSKALSALTLYRELKEKHQLQNTSAPGAQAATTMAATDAVADPSSASLEATTVSGGYPSTLMHGGSSSAPSTQPAEVGTMREAMTEPLSS